MRQKRFAHRTVEYYQKMIVRRAKSRYPSPVVKKMEAEKEVEKTEDTTVEQ